MDLRTLVFPEDIYRVTKVQLQDILTNFNIKFREDDTVANIRPIIADLKSYFKDNVTEEKRRIFNKLVQKKTCLNAGELEKYPDLVRIEEFIRERENIYDRAETNDAEESLYEDVGSQGGSGNGKLQETDQTQGLNRANIKQQNNNGSVINMSKEKLPLISAGNYHGLPSENPLDFLDRYEIAAISNKWTNETKVNLFPAHLASTALAWYRHSIKEGTVNEWEELKKIFTKTFTPAAQAQTLQSLIENKVQARDQSALAYLMEVLTLCRRHDPEIKDKQIIQYVIQGLKPEICELILNEDCENLQQLQDSVKKIELQLEVRSLNRQKYNRADTSAKSEVPQHTSKLDLQNMQLEIKTLTQEVQRLTIAQNKNQTLQNQRNGQPRGNYYSRNNTHTRHDGGRHVQPYQQGRGRQAVGQRPLYNNK